MSVVIEAARLPGPGGPDGPDGINEMIIAPVMAGQRL